MDEDFIDDDRSLEQNLRDTGMEPGIIEEFLEYHHAKQRVAEKQILLEHRSRLLTNVHDSQVKLYRMDFLMRKLKANKRI